MTKKTPETLLAILDTLASGNVVYSDAAKANGVKPNTFWHWMRASQLSRDPDLIVPYLGEAMPFHVAVEAARQIALHDTRARTEKRTKNYLGEPTFFRDIPAFDPVAEIAPRDVVAEPERPSVAEPDIDLDELLGPEPTPVDDAEIVPDKLADPVVPDKPGVIPDNRSPIAFDEAPRHAARSPLEADLLARLAAARAKNASRTDDGTTQTEGAPQAA